MIMRVRRLSYALGAEVMGVDLSKPLDDKTFSAVNQAFLEYCVLLFRGQCLTRGQHMAFSRRFGELETYETKPADVRVADVPEILLVVSRPKPNGEPASGRHTGAEWHTDTSHLPIAAAASLLRAVELPGIGGDTMFANMYRAYDTLSGGMKSLLAGLHGVHMLTKAEYDLSTPERAAESRRQFPAAAHPVVRVHPESGRKALYVNDQVRLFVGMTSAESKPLLSYLTQHAVRPQNVYRHRWEKDDLVMWDNRCLLHTALADYDRTRIRHMERTTVHGDLSGYVYEGPPE